MPANVATTSAVESLFIGDRPDRIKITIASDVSIISTRSTIAKERLRGRRSLISFNPNRLRFILTRERSNVLPRPGPIGPARLARPDLPDRFRWRHRLAPGTRIFRHLRHSTPAQPTDAAAP